MEFRTALQIVDSIVSQVAMPRAGHLEAQQAIAALELHYEDALTAVEQLQAQLDTQKVPTHR